MQEDIYISWCFWNLKNFITPEDDGMSIEICRDNVNLNITLWIFCIIVGLFKLNGSSVVADYTGKRNYGNTKEIRLFKLIFYTNAKSIIKNPT
jgi:hypothetical protein